MMLDILLTNREQILIAAGRFAEHFQALITLLESAAEPELGELTDCLQAGRQNRLKLLDPEHQP